MSLSPTLCGAAFAGLVSHTTFFIRGEHHIRAPKLSMMFFVLSNLIFLGHLATYDYNLQCAAGATLSIMAAYCAAIFGSIIVYRTLFHKLRKFPGPPMAKFTKLWHMWKVLGFGNHLLMEEMHEKYGDFVRIGPNEVVIFKAEAVHALHGVGSKCNKAPMYDILLPKTSLSTTRDHAFHDARRRIWDRGFSVKALNGYGEIVMQHTVQLNGQIAKSAGAAINVTSLFYYYAFDIIGRLAFEKSFNMLEKGASHPEASLLRQGMSLLGPLTPVPWLARIGLSVPIPGLIHNWKKMVRWSGKQLKERLETSTHGLNMTSGLIDVSKNKITMEEDHDLLVGDAFTVLIAGSDTVTSAMTFLFYHLALEPSHASKLRSELAPLALNFDPKSLHSLPHLNGIVNETLRLHPPVPTSSLRTTPPEGMVIAGQYIPGNTTVSVPGYSLGRLESYYVRAADFVPERWYSYPHMIKNKDAFAPFSKGRYRCVGRELALMELRSVAASLVWNYDVAFAPGEDGVRVCADMKDHFTSHPGRLRLVFRPRGA